MDRSQEIFSLFEGVCPICETSVTLFRASGNKQFIVEQGWVIKLSEIDFTAWAESKWTKNSEVVEIGDVEFRCQNEHEFYISYSRHGSWE